MGRGLATSWDGEIFSYAGHLLETKKRSLCAVKGYDLTDHGGRVGLLV